ncbi:hypothetical protein ACEA31_23940, partial [Escherichia coli]
KKLIMLPSETMIWQPEFTDKTLSRKPGAVHSQWAAICSIAPKIGCTPETLRVWVRQHERDTGYYLSKKFLTSSTP